MVKVTVILPVYNGENFIEDSIESILNQTLKEFELIIIDNCSIDNTEKIIKSFNDKRINYIRNQKNMGYVYSLNEGLKRATGQYIPL